MKPNTSWINSISVKGQRIAEVFQNAGCRLVRRAQKGETVGNVGLPSRDSLSAHKLSKGIQARFLSIGFEAAPLRSPFASPDDRVELQFAGFLLLAAGPTQEGPHRQNECHCAYLVGILVLSTRYERAPSFGIALEVVEFSMKHQKEWSGEQARGIGVR